MGIKYLQLPGKLLLSSNDELVEKCINLYSNHYGIWGIGGPNPGKNVKLSKNKFSEWLNSDVSSIYYAMLDDELIGYAIAIRAKAQKIGTVTWVTQLVVHREYRNQGIAKDLLFSIWGLSTDAVWGILSSNPYAIRALEKATRRRATPVRIKKNLKKLKNIGEEYVPYINKDTEIKIDEHNSQVNTHFFVSHEQTQDMLDSVTKTVPWLLGCLEEGWEWFAFTFKDQEQFSLSKEEIQHMVDCSDSVAKIAYQNMILNPNEQKWMRHTQAEIDYITSKLQINDNSFIYDIGCGIGRHSLELAQKGFTCVGIDYIESNIQQANNSKEILNLSNVDFLTADCRTFRNDTLADLIICLYDVIGSFVNETDNIDILKTIYSLLKPNGYAVISVMNYESTVHNAKYTFNIDTTPDSLLTLPASDTMQASGNIFNPEYYLVDTISHITYRKEQFTSQHHLPKELIVRDKRYTMDEIISLVQNVGLKVVQKKYVNASDWNIAYSATDPKAKEILIICKKTL